ncbi:MAG: sensor histidine kinase [Anaerolineales bacterium]|nr:sensor histidine kinase [Anaerolineales bacterium]
MMKNRELANSHVWEKWDWVFHAISYSVLILQSLLFLSNDLKYAATPALMSLSALLAFWYFPLMFRRDELWVIHPARTLAYQIIGWVIWGFLIASHPAALMLAAMFYPILFARMPIRWAIFSASIMTVGLLLNSFFSFDMDRSAIPTFIILGIMGLGTAIIIGSFINSLIMQSHERQRLIDELSQTRANLLKVEREAGILAERQRLAREIHDTLAQDFTSIIMHLTAARLNNSGTSYLQQAEQTAREGLEEARRIVWALRPEQLEHSTLVESIEGFAARWSAENGVSVNAAITGIARPLGPEKDAALLRVTQEAMNNIKKHARASRVDITLSYMPDLVALDIVDDGIGFEKGHHQGFGLKTMRERVEELRGALVIESQREKGTAIAISLPIQEDA